MQNLIFLFGFGFRVVFGVCDACHSLISALEILGVPLGLGFFFPVFFPICIMSLHGDKYMPILIH